MRYSLVDGGLKMHIYDNPFTSMFARIAELMIWASLILLPHFSLSDVPVWKDPFLASFYLVHPFWSAWMISVSTALFASFMIYGGLPLEVLAKRERDRQNLLQAARNLPRQGASDHERRASLFLGLSKEGIQSIEAAQTLDPREILGWFTVDTNATSKRIYRRSNNFIIFGSIISAVGLSLFYYMTISTPPEIDIAKRLFSMVPNISVLIFVELIAFFFLRQHRLSMDEFRYFEQVKRMREENLIIMKMFAENKSIFSPKDVLDNMKIYSHPETIDKDKTTEILELRRGIRDEMNLVGKIISAARWIKPTVGSEKDKD